MTDHHVVFTSDTHGATDHTAALRALLDRVPHALLLDAGDAFVGSRFFTTQGTAGMARVMARLGVRVMCLGNHELEHAAEIGRFARAANLTVVSSNVRGVDGVVPSVVLRHGTVRYGITGYTEVSPDQSEQVLAAVRREARRLRPRVDFLIVLGHGGLEFDQRIALALQGVVDAVLGGHWHQIYVQQRPVVVVHAGHSGQHYGLLRIAWRGRRVVRVAASVEALVHAPTQGAVVLAHLDDGLTQGPISHVSSCRTARCGAGELVVQLMHAAAQCCACHSATQMPLIALREAGSIRGALQRGPFTVESLSELLPWNNKLVVLRCTGGVVKDMLAYGRRIMGGARLQAAGLDEDSLRVLPLRPVCRSSLLASTRLQMRQTVLIGHPLRDSQTVRVVVTKVCASKGNSPLCFSFSQVCVCVLFFFFFFSFVVACKWWRWVSAICAAVPRGVGKPRRRGRFGGILFFGWALLHRVRVCGVPGHWWSSGICGGGVVDLPAYVGHDTSSCGCLPRVAPPLGPCAHGVFRVGFQWDLLVAV